jgi:alpha-1,6-mannosyltransferase
MSTPQNTLMSFVAIDSLSKGHRPSLLLRSLGFACSLFLLFQSLLRQHHFQYASNALQHVLFGVAYICIITIYFVWLIYELPKQENNTEGASIYRTIFKSSPFLLLAFIYYPTTSDIYSYLHSGLMLLHGINPYLTTLGAFTSPISPYLEWKQQTSPYGPVSQLFFAIAAAYTIFGLTIAVYTFKLFCVLFHLLSVVLIWTLARRSTRRHLITIAYLVNPFLLFEYIAQAHVDVIMNFIVVLSIFLIVRARFLLSSLTILFGALCKTLPIIWLPLLWLYFLHNKMWKSLALSSCCVVCVIKLLLISALPTYAAWISLLNPATTEWQSAGSLHQLLDTSLYYASGLLPTAASGAKSYRISVPFKMFTYGAYAAYYLWLCARRLECSCWDRRQLILDMAWSTFFLFLFATPWYQPWYAALFVSFTAILLAVGHDDASVFFGIVASVYCLCSASYYVFLFPNAPIIASAATSLITVVPAFVVLLIGKDRIAKTFAPVLHPLYTNTSATRNSGYSITSQ